MVLLLFALGVLVFGVWAAVEDTEGAAVLILGAAVCIIFAFVSNGPLESSRVTGIDPLVSVNGYYVDPDGNYVTESNERGVLSSNCFQDGLLEKDVTTRPHILTIEKKFRPQWFHAVLYHKETSKNIIFGAQSWELSK